MSFYSEQELEQIGFQSYGLNVRISKKSSIYNPSNIVIGSNVRIDDFCVLSAGEGGIYIGDYVHIAVFSSLMGQGRIIMEAFSGLSSRVSVYSSNDDYSGKSLTNPTIPDEFRRVQTGEVYIGKHAIVGAGSILLPNARLEEGVAVGALSLIAKRCEEFSVYSGMPAKRIKSRKRDLLEYEQKLLSS